MSLIVTGSIGIDTVITPWGRADEVLGGSSVYFSAAASFFSPVRLVGAVGDDFPRDFLKVFEHFKVCTKGLEIRKGAKTFRWTGQYMQNMNDRETVDVKLNILAEALPPVPPEYRDSKYIFLANTHPAGQLALLDQFTHPSLVVADTMDLWINNEREMLGKLLERLDGLVLNDSEALLLTGERNMAVASRQILRMGPKFVVIKKGEHGCMLRHHEGMGILHAFPAMNVVDPTGAGDSFGGGMMGYLAAAGSHRIKDIKRALAYGTIAASFNIEAFSLQRLKEISRRDIDQRMAEYSEYTSFA